MELSMKSRRELTRVMARRYRGADRRGKGHILDEFVATTGYVRAYAALLLREYGKERLVGGGGETKRIVGTKRRRKGGGRPTRYGAEVQRAVQRLWKHFGYLCGKRLVVVIRASLPYLDAWDGLRVEQRTRDALATISAASVDRLLAPARKKLLYKGRAHTRPASALKAQIPVRTFSEWDKVAPGHVQLDLVAHEGGVASGEYCYTLSLTDVCTGWTEQRALLSRAAKWVCQELDSIRLVLPFPILEIHPDSGAEFININLATYCKQHGIRMSRSRPGRKNDNCYVEQKNFDSVRKLVGYYRYAGQQAVRLLNELYVSHGVLQNYVYPSQKLLSKTRHGAKLSRRYDAPQTPADRLLARQETSMQSRWRVHAVCQDLNPLLLSSQVNTLQERVIDLALGSLPGPLPLEEAPA
jgi:transposase InsO family protein